MVAEAEALHDLAVTANTLHALDLILAETVRVGHQGLHIAGEHGGSGNEMFVPDSASSNGQLGSQIRRSTFIREFLTPVLELMVQRSNAGRRADSLDITRAGLLS